jgi:protein-tyrosine phosphatase
MHSIETNKYLLNVRSQSSISVHIVCLGNICRSPLANAVLLNLTKDLTKPKVIVDSSGIGPWHVGQSAAKYSTQSWQDAGYKYVHVAKQFKVDFFNKHDLILAMDLNNREDLLRLAKTQADKEKIFMFTSFDSKKTHIDPKGPEGGYFPCQTLTEGRLKSFNLCSRLLSQQQRVF